MRSLVAMSQSFRTVAGLFGLAGLLTLIRQVVELSDPAYYNPVTTLDYVAAWLTSIAVGTTAVALLVWWRRTPIRRGSWLLMIAGLTFAVSAAGNLLEDVFDLAIGGDLFTAGIVGFGATILAGVLALTVSDPYRWSGLFLIGYAAGLGFPDSGGLWLAGASLIGMAYWITRVSTEAESRPDPRP